MATSILEQYRVSDFLEWHRKKALMPNPYFQRRSVWTNAAKVFLIDTILRRLPIPKIYLRTKIDLSTKVAFREIVDGQQRLRAVIEFAEDKLTLTKRANEFSGLNYSRLPSELKEAFLTYPIAVEQLINASDNDVLEVFARLNSYNVMLNIPEKRHAKFQGDFKWAVHRASKDWAILWEKYEIVSVRERLRMLDDSFMAEMFGVLLHGVRDGGQARITKLYDAHEREFPQESVIRRRLDKACECIDDSLGETVVGPIASTPHFLMLFAAVSHAIFGIPRGEMGNEMPSKSRRALRNLATARGNLAKLGQIIDGDMQDPAFDAFFRSSKASTQRISSRRVRFPVFFRALLDKPI